MSQITASNTEICFLRSHISDKLACLKSANLQKSLIFRSFTVVPKEPHPMEIANSPNVGICLCCGTWLEGGRKLTGKDPEEMINYFGAKKIWKIHFRNVSAPLPHFVETFMDDGYYDMYKIMRALRKVNFDGIVI